jgi:low affinity Fe/Cu permease
MVRLSLQHIFLLTNPIHSVSILTCTILFRSKYASDICLNLSLSVLLFTMTLLLDGTTAAEIANITSTKMEITCH